MDVGQYAAAMKLVGLTDVGAEDCTAQFLGYLRSELALLQASREAFLDPGPEGNGGFSEVDYVELEEGWMSKIRWCSSGDMRWGVFRGAKPVCLDPAGWKHNTGGDVAGGQPAAVEHSPAKGGNAHFKHSNPLCSGEVWRMRFIFQGGDCASIGLAAVGYDPESHVLTQDGTAEVGLGDGSTSIGPGISLDGQEHYHEQGQLEMPQCAMLDVAIRCDPDGNVPQMQFSEDGVWHDFAPSGRSRVALHAGPWFPYLALRRNHA
jgi:hypothetical protein